MKDLFERHYQAIRKRGLITDKTTITDFYFKMLEEDKEASKEIIHFMKSPNNKDKMIQEIIDKICVCTNFLRHMDIDLELELCKNVIHQETRKD